MEKMSMETTNTNTNTNSTAMSGSNLVELKLHNVVATANLGTKLDLGKLALHASSEYNPRRFSALIMRLQSPKATALIFSSGKIVITGAPNPIQCHFSARRVTTIIRKLGVDAQLTEFTIRNLVGSCDFKHKIDLNKLNMSDHGYDCTYEPEIFPGMVYRLQNPRVTLLIFATGKVVFTGAKEAQQIHQALALIQPVVAQFRKS